MKNQEAFFFPSIFGYYGLYSSLQGFFSLSVFFVIFTVILSEFSQISLIWICFFFWKKVPEMSLVLHMSYLYCFLTDETWIWYLHGELRNFPAFWQNQEKYRKFWCSGGPKMMVAGEWNNNNKNAHLAQRLYQTFISKLFSCSEP